MRIYKSVKNGNWAVATYLTLTPDHKFLATLGLVTYYTITRVIDLFGCLGPILHTAPLAFPNSRPNASKIYKFITTSLLPPSYVVLGFLVMLLLFANYPVSLPEPFPLFDDTCKSMRYEIQWRWQLKMTMTIQESLAYILRSTTTYLFIHVMHTSTNKGMCLCLCLASFLCEQHVSVRP